jgi:hypothetical protein
LGIIDLGGRVDPHDEEPKPPNGELRNWLPTYQLD